MVLDDGRYSAAFAAGKLDRRPMFDRLTPTGVVWADGTAEPVDAVILATGYRPDVDYLPGLGALNADGWPIHCRGRSLTVPRTRLRRAARPDRTGVGHRPRLRPRRPPHRELAAPHPHRRPAHPGRMPRPRPSRPMNRDLDTGRRARAEIRGRVQALTSGLRT